MSALAVRSSAAALVAAAAPVALWVLRRYRLLPLWLLSLEMTLGGWGHLLDLRGLPVRHALLATVMFGWALNKAIDRDWQLRGGRHLLGVGVFLSFVAVAVLASLAIGNPYAFEDGVTPFFLLLVLPFFDIAARPRGVHVLLQCFITSVFVLSIVQIALTSGIFAGQIDANWLAIVFDQRIGGVVQLAGPFWRVFIVGSIFYQVAILLLAAGLLAGQPFYGPKRDAIVLIAATISLLLTFTRGYWASALIGLGVLALLTSPRARVRMALVALAGLALLLVVIPVTDIAIVDVLWQRVLLTFNPDRDISVALRLDLYPRLMARFAERPLFGYGFGVLVENQLYYENSYLYYVIKVGLVGLAVIAVGWVVLLISAVQLARRHPDPRTRALSAGMTAAVVSMLAVTAINPFINSAVGLYFQAVATAVVFGLSSAMPPTDRSGA